MERGVEIYRSPKGEIVFNVDAENDTLWATQAQIAQIFDVKPQNITYHLRNIYTDNELNKTQTCKESLQVQDEGGVKVQRKVKVYNLDAIISVGYRVNSKKATDFRIWATKVLRGYLTNGVVINKDRLKTLDSKRLKEVEGMMGVVRRLIAHQALDVGEANGVLEVISKYSTSFEMLKEYDDGFIDLSEINGTSKKAQKKLSLDLVSSVIDNLRRSVDGGELFGKPRGGTLDGSLNAIYQTQDGAELYPTIAEKAAHLLYFIIKDHPFYDGNKRIGSLLFIMFLTINDCHLTKNGETKISDRALTAIALLIAESSPSEKPLITSLVVKLLEK